MRVVLPAHLKALAKVTTEVQLEVGDAPTLRRVLDTLETQFPVLKGTIRDHVTQKRRAFLRFFACESDLTHDSPDTPLPEAVIRGTEPLIILGAMAGG